MKCQGMRGAGETRRPRLGPQRLEELKGHHSRRLPPKGRGARQRWRKKLSNRFAEQRDRGRDAPHLAAFTSS